MANNSISKLHDALQSYNCHMNMIFHFWVVEIRNLVTKLQIPNSKYLRSNQTQTVQWKDPQTTTKNAQRSQIHYSLRVLLIIAHS